MLVWLYPVNISEGIAETVTLTYREGGVAKDFTGYTATWRVIQEGAVWASGTATLATGLISVPMSAAQTAIPKPTKAQKLNAAAVLEVTATNGGVTIVFNATVIVARREDSESGLGILSSAAPTTPPPNGKATPQHFGALGDGVSDDRPAFAALNAWGGEAYLPKPTVAYNVSSPITMNNVSVEIAPTLTWTQATDAGAITWGETPPGFYPDTDGTFIRREFNRMFVFDGAQFTGNWSGSQQGFIPTSAEGANWAIRDAAFLSANRCGMMSIVGIASNEVPERDSFLVTAGVAAFSIAKHPPVFSRALYADMQFEDGVTGMAIETAIKNRSGVSTIQEPYTATQFKTAALYLPAGGDPASGGTGNANICAALFLTGANTTGQQYNRGIVFMKHALARDGNSRGVAVTMAERHELEWMTFHSTRALAITSEVNSSTQSVEIAASNLGIELRGQGRLPLVRIESVANVDNHLLLRGGVTGTMPSISSQGSAADVDLSFFPKGAGRVRFGAFVPTSDVAIVGHIEIKDGAGTIRKLAVVA